MQSNAAKLMYGGKGTDRRMISHRHVSRDRSGVRHDYTVADNAVMGHVAIGHKKTLAPDNSNPPATPGAAIEGDKLPEHIIVADFQIGRFSLVLEVLRIRPDGAVAEETASFADTGPTMNDYVRIQDGARPYLGMRPDDAVGPNFSSR